MATAKDAELQELIKEENSWREPSEEARLLGAAEESLAAARREVLLSGGLAVPQKYKSLLRELPTQGEGAMVENPLLAGRRQRRKAAAAAAPPPPPLTMLDHAAHRFQLGGAAGLFCPKRCAPCARPCCGKRESDFAELGSGVSAYFKLEKTLATLFGLCTLFSIPLLLVNLNGGNDGVTSLNPVASTTLGNVAGFNGTSFLVLPLVGQTRIAASSVFYGALDVLCVVMFLCTYIWAKVFVQKEEKAVDAGTLTLQDYSLLLPNVAPGTTEEDVRSWVQRVVLSTAKSGALDGNRAVLEVNEAQAEAPSPRMVVLDERGRNKEDALREAFAVRAVALVHDYAAVEGALRRSGGVKAQAEALKGASIAAALRGHAAARAPPPGALARLLCAWRAPPAPEKLAAARLAVRRNELLADCQLDALVAKQLGAAGKPKKAFPVVAAVVSFEHAAARDMFLGVLPTGALGRALAHAHLRLNGAVPRAAEVEAPSSIMYKNLRFTPLARFVRTLFSNAVAVLVISVCFGIIIQISGVDQSFQRKITPEDCSARTLSSFVKFYNTKKSGEDERQFLKLYPFTNPLMYCVCDSRGYNTAPAASLEGDLYLRKCVFQSCPRMTTLKDARAKDWAECAQIADWKFTATIFHTVAGVIITLVNMLLGFTVRALSGLEGHYNIVEQGASIGVRVFVSMVFNTLVLTMLINMRLGIFPTGLYSDFTPGWYANVGAGFITQMFTQAVVPHIGGFVGLLMQQLKWRNPRLFLTNANRATLTAMLGGPAMDFSVRSAQLMMVVFVCFILSSNLPLMYAAAFTALTGAFWADKLFTTRLYRSPPFSGAAVVAKMVEYMPFALLAHLGVALWTVSDMQLLDSTATLVPVDPLRSAEGAAAASASPTPSPSPAPRVPTGSLRRAAAAAVGTAAAANGAVGGGGGGLLGPLRRALTALAALTGGGAPAPPPPLAGLTHALGAHFDGRNGTWVVGGATVLNPRGHRLSLRVAAALSGCGGGAVGVPASTPLLPALSQGGPLGVALPQLRLERQVGGPCSGGACCLVVDCVAAAAPFECPQGVAIAQDAAPPRVPRRLQGTSSPTGSVTATPTPSGLDSPSSTLSGSFTVGTSFSNTPSTTATGTPTPSNTRPAFSASQTPSAPSGYGYSIGGCACRSACQLDFVNGATAPSAVCLVGGGRRLQATPSPTPTASDTPSPQMTTSGTRAVSASISPTPSGTVSSPSATVTPTPASGSCAAPLAYAQNLGGRVDGCALPSLGFTNRGCNCTSACAPRAALSTTGRAACTVDVLCPASFSGETPSGWWDFCDAPSAVRAEPLPYCALRFFDPVCQTANASAPEDLKNLGKYLAVPGSNYTFSFVGAAFTKTVLGGGSGATSTGRGAALGAATSASMAVVEAGRAILTSTIPLTSALGLTVGVLLLTVFALLLKSLARLLIKRCTKKKTVPLEQAVQSATPKRVKKKGTTREKMGAAAEEPQSSYAVPLSQALQGKSASNGGKELHLVGSSYSIRAQAHVYEDLCMVATLCSAHVDLKPEHLAFAEVDGVFEDDAPGLLFLTPFLWESADKMKACAERLKSAGIAKLPKRSCPEGYKERLRRWVEQQPGKLDSRTHHPEMWEDWVYKKGKRGSASTNNGSE